MDSLNKWLTLISNVAVVAGIVFLGLEINQANELAQANAFSMRINNIDQQGREYALSPDLAALKFKWDSEGLESLTLPQQDRLRSWERARMERFQGQFDQYERGFYPAEYLDSDLDLIKTAFKRRWAELGILEAVINPRWKAAIDSL